MGTSNFYYRNTSCCYVVGNYELEEGEDYYITDLYWKDDLRYFKNKFKEEIEKDKRFHLTQSDESIFYMNEHRTSLGCLSISKDIKLPDRTITIGVSADMFVSPGYYEAACLDYTDPSYDYGYTSCTDTLPEVTYVKEDLNWYHGFEDDYSEEDFNSFCETCSDIVSSLETLRDELGDKIEELFSMVSEKYARVATFSNGETIYKKIENNE